LSLVDEEEEDVDFLLLVVDPFSLSSSNFFSFFFEDAVAGVNDA
jgi:hypothetical protein